MLHSSTTFPSVTLSKLKAIEKTPGCVLSEADIYSLLRADMKRSQHMGKRLKCFTYDGVRNPNSRSFTQIAPKSYLIVPSTALRMAEHFGYFDNIVNLPLHVQSAINKLVVYRAIVTQAPLSPNALAA